MAPHCLFGVSLVLLGALSVSFCAACRVSGLWKTENGITMTIRLYENGSFNGTFRKAGHDAEATLAGYQQDGDQPTFSFTVKPKSTDSIISYIGQCFLPPDGEDLLLTTRIVKEHASNHTQDTEIKIACERFTRIYVV
ncbi:avidin-related protein 4/5-like [Ambystoma mexicanum]|uniref:avidin-related protein 4/5-like n=1 Tax=Ambystoma mexicanum TaxID=8296 RepID=UPI0037E8796C